MRGQFVRDVRSATNLTEDQRHKVLVTRAARARRTRADLEVADQIRSVTAHASARWSTPP